MSSADRRQREIARIRGDILDAAARAFARAGYREATMQDIAREAGYTAASLYTYFHSKQAIFEGLVGRMNEEYLALFDAPMPGGLTFAQKLELLTRRHLELTDLRRDVFVTFFTLRPGPDLVPACKAGENPFHQAFEARIGRLVEWLREHARPEDVGGHDLDLVARFLIGMGFALMHRWMRVAPGERLADLAPTLLQLFFHGVLGKPAAGAQE